MGYVIKTTTEYAGELSKSETLHFETYEDFVKYSFVLDDKMEEKVCTCSPTCEPTSSPFVALTDSQIYKLRILLGHVLGDKDCADLNEQLDYLCNSELYCEDYDEMFFTCVVNDATFVLENGDKEVTIQFK